MSDELEPVETEEPKRCLMCERIGGIFGIAVSVILLFISIDILTGGSLANLISGGPAEETE